MWESQTALTSTNLVKYLQTTKNNIEQKAGRSNTSHFPDTLRGYIFEKDVYLQAKVFDKPKCPNALKSSFRV
jgi:hypothetical protein